MDTQTPQKNQKESSCYLNVFKVICFSLLEGFYPKTHLSMTFNMPHCLNRLMMISVTAHACRIYWFYCFLIFLVGVDRMSQSAYLLCKLSLNDVKKHRNLISIVHLLWGVFILFAQFNHVMPVKHKLSHWSCPADAGQVLRKASLLQC